MATPAQITANRANAQKSTGPRSVEGKSASRFNALKHGIDAASIVIPGEDPADYAALAAESPGASLAAALLSESPAARLLARVQRQIAAFERTWYRANAEIRRARKQTEDAPGQSLENYLDRFHATTGAQLASFRQSPAAPPPAPPAAPTSPRNWPPIDPISGKPACFVG